MKNLLTPAFFNFVVSFFAILATSLGIILLANYYELTFADVGQAASALLFELGLYE